MRYVSHVHRIAREYTGSRTCKATSIHRDSLAAPTPAHSAGMSNPPPQPGPQKVSVSDMCETHCQITANLLRIGCRAVRKRDKCVPVLHTSLFLISGRHVCRVSSLTPSRNDLGDSADTASTHNRASKTSRASLASPNQVNIGLALTSTASQLSSHHLLFSLLLLFVLYGTCALLRRPQHRKPNRAPAERTQPKLKQSRKGRKRGTT
eukprot:2031408-Rhodomonas_salina.2